MISPAMRMISDKDNCADTEDKDDFTDDDSEDDFWLG